MASFHGLAGKIRGLVESDEVDLGSLQSDAAATELLTNAFGTKFDEPLSDMVRVTLVVGAGKANRQKYHASLQKWVVGALNALGYVDDKSASCDFASAGSFKTQHDTGRNLFFVHVFPRCERKAASAPAAAPAEAPEPEALSREHLLCASELPTFKRTVQKKTPSWASRKRLLEALRALRGAFRAMDQKLCNREALADDEQRLYELGSVDDLDEKISFLQAACKEMVDAGRLTRDEKAQALEQMDARLDALPAGSKQRARIAENQAALEARDVSDYTPPKLEHEAAIKALHAKLAPLAALEKRLAKGQLLSVQEAGKLGEKADIEERIAALEDASRSWYETDEELAARLVPLRANLQRLTLKHAAPKPPASSGGWSTAGSGRKQPSSRTGKKPAPGKRSGGGFAALAD